MDPPPPIRSEAARLPTTARSGWRRPSSIWALLGIGLLAVWPLNAPEAQPDRQLNEPRTAERVVLMLAPEPAERLKQIKLAQRAQSQRVALPEYLHSRRVVALHALDISRGLAGNEQGRQNGLATKLGLDRIFVATLAPGSDPAEVSRTLEADPKVVYAHPDFYGQGGGSSLPDTEDPWFSQLWHIHNTGQSGGTADADMDGVEAWRTTVGRAETLFAVLDSGIDGDHQEFRGRIVRGGFDFVNEDDDPESDQNHGSRVSGIIGANTHNRFSVAGVHWNASIVPIKVLDSDNNGSTSDLVQGLMYTANIGADIANLSLIRYPNTTSLRLAVEYAHAAGVILIGCNGNDGLTQLNYPASYPGILSTGWTDDDDQRANNSNFTSSLDVVAPGHAVRTVVHDSTINFSSVFSGCSAATPNVAAVTGLLKGLDPTLTYEQVADILRTTADDEVGVPGEDVPGRDDHHGWGRVNAHRAVQSLGQTSARRIHVEAISLHRVFSDRMEVQVTVLNELNGVERDVLVEGLLHLPDGSAPVLLSGPTASNGVAVLPYSSPAPLAPGTYTFELQSLSLPGHSYDPAENRESVETHDPDYNGLHVGALWAEEVDGNLIFDVQVVDDDDLPEDLVQVTATLSSPTGPEGNLQQLSRGARGGIARFQVTPQPPGSEALQPGLYQLQVTELEKTGFAYDAGLDEAGGLIAKTVNDPAGDSDSDGILNAVDNCPATGNADQADSDGDGFGDTCDVCPALFDPSQNDSDQDGVGNRCDCAPWDAAATLPGPILSVRHDGAQFRWNASPGADRYDILRGHLAGVATAQFGECWANDIFGFALGDADIPAPGEGFTYLIQADDAICGPGLLAPSSDGTPRVPSGPGGCTSGD